eukprot:377682-Pleurochrysis_carterae.AAC.1
MRVRGGRRGTLRQWSSSPSQSRPRGGADNVGNEGECCPCVTDGSGTKRLQQPQGRCQHVECDATRKEMAR